MDDGFEVLFWPEAHDGLGLSFRRNEDEQRYRAGAEEVGQFFFLIDIDFVEDHLIAKFFGEFGNDGTEPAAWSAPVGIEIDDARFVALIVPDRVFGVVEDVGSEFGSSEVSHVVLCPKRHAKCTQKGYNEDFFH